MNQEDMKMMTIKAIGEWVVLEKQEEKSGSFIVIDGNSATVIAVGDECPDSIQELVGEKVVYSQVRSAEELDGFIAVNWREIFWKVAE
jgi:hypothetical protein